MITEALRHCPGIGPARLAHLHKLGIRTWSDVVAGADRVSRTWGQQLVEESRRCLQALQTSDIRYFTDQFSPHDKWRIVAHFLDQASFFDIETAGLEADDPITLICCWHAGQLHYFLEDENLDDFLELLDEIQLLISFNGCCFDVPRVLDAFHIPELPCAHLDLRWPCYHQGMKGGLKQITSRLGITRPADLAGAHGELAVQLWNRWQNNQDQSARSQLIRYCAADVLMLVRLAHHVAGRVEIPGDEIWCHLPDMLQPVRTSEPEFMTRRGFGPGSPLRIRAHRSRLVG